MPSFIKSVARFGAVGDIFDTVTGKAAKDAKNKANNALAAGQAELKKSARKASRSRSALFETAGGVVGQELAEGGVTQRDSLLGN